MCLFISFLSLLLNQFLQSEIIRQITSWWVIENFLLVDISFLSFSLNQLLLSEIIMQTSSSFQITHITVVFDMKIKCSRYNCSVAFHLNLQFKLNSFLRLLEFSAGSRKRREQRLTKKTIKYKGRCNLPFWLQGHLKLFLENYYFLENFEMTQLAGDGRIMLFTTLLRTAYKMRNVC